MIIGRKYARKLVDSGKAREDGLTTDGDRWPDGVHYVVVTRHDIQRTDHYAATGDDEARILAGQAEGQSDA